MKMRKVLALFLCAVLLIGSIPVSAAKTVRVFTALVSEKTYWSGAPTAQVTAGDINGDGKVNNKDLTRLFQYLSDWEVEVGEDLLDVNGDGKVNNKDLTRLFQYLSDWEVEIFPEPVTCDHSGDKQIRGVTEPTCGVDGYTGDTYCLDCGRVIATGEIIPATGRHTETEIRDATEPTCGEDGYTGDTYCLNCGLLIATGEIIHATGNHTGGTATCHSGAICEVCGAEYGTYDYNNHDGGTAIVGACDPTDTEPGYSGNEICLGCQQVLSYGNYYDKSHTYHYGDDSATYYHPGICAFCRKEYYAQMSAYDCLNENQKGFYRRLQNMVYFLEMSLVQVTEYCGDFTTYEDDINIALTALSHDRPDMFWIPRNIYVFYSYNSRTGQIIDVYLTFNPEEYYNTAENQREVYGLDEAMRDAMLEQLDAKVDEAVALTASLDNNFEKEIVIHDYICGHVRYDYDTAGISNPYATVGADPTAGGGYNPLSFTAYGALVNGRAVCEGYSRAMQLICQKIGIPCGLITGFANGKGHMWNIINPGDGCYYLDVTFDDTTIDLDSYGLTCIYTHFNITKLEMEADHIFDDMYYEGAPTEYYDETGMGPYIIEYNFFDTHGDNTALEYYTATGAYIAGSDAESAANYAMDMYNKGYTYVALKFEPAIGSDNAYNAVKKALKKQRKDIDNRYNIIGNDIIIIKFIS